MRRTLHRVRPSVARAVLDHYADVLKCSERLEEVEALVDEADLLPPDGSEVRLVHVCHLDTANMYVSVCRFKEGAGNCEERSLAGTRRSHDGYDLAAANIKRDVRKGGDAEVAGAVNFADALQLKDQRWRALHRAIP